MDSRASRVLREEVDPEEYPTIKGLEGPFRFLSGRILYWDKFEGQYWDKKGDIFLNTKEAFKEQLVDLPPKA